MKTPLRISNVKSPVDDEARHTILFLRIDPDASGKNRFTARLFVRSQHSIEMNSLPNEAVSLTDTIALEVSTTLLKRLERFEQMRRLTGDVFRFEGKIISPLELYDKETDLSSDLYNTFFAGAIGAVIEGFIDLLDRQKLGELLLVISSDDETITNLPWETVIPCLFHSGPITSDKLHLAINTFGLVRTKEKSLQNFDVRGRTDQPAPIKMLFVTALPENLREGDKLLQIEAEQQKLIQAVGNLEVTGSEPKIVVEFLDNAALIEIDQALSARRHDIVHISGHGAFLSSFEKGVLYLEDEDGDERKTTGAELGAVLRRHKSVKILILSACETAVSGHEGMIEQLSKAGIPGILAMRFPITDPGAQVFTTALYAMLAKGATLTHAVANAREAMWQNIREQRRVAPELYHIDEWFTPVLYLNQYIGPLVDLRQPYYLSDDFYPRSRFESGATSRFIGQGFIGRKRYLIRLRKAFMQHRHVCLLGLGGLGKTTLAEAFARSYRNRALTVLKFEGLEINIATILKRIYAHFCTLRDVPEDMKISLGAVVENKDLLPADRLGRLLRSCLDPNGTILLFDNFEDVQTGNAGLLKNRIESEELREFLIYLCENAPENCHVLFTTRYQIVDLDLIVEHLSVAKLTYAEQYRLMNFAAHSSPKNPFGRLVWHEREAIIRRFDGHPRAYEFLEALLSRDPTLNWESVDAALGKAEAQVIENLLIDRVYAQMTVEVRSVFRAATVFIAPTRVEALAAVTGQPPATLISVLRTLAQWSVCWLDDEQQSFEIHRLTRTWSEPKLFTEAAHRELSEKAGTFFFEQNTLESHLLAKAYFERAQATEAMIKVTRILERNFRSNGICRQAIDLNKIILDVSGNEEYVLDALNNLGELYANLAEYAEALDYYFEVLRQRMHTGDVAGLASILNNIGNVYTSRGEYVQAKDYLRQSLEHWKACGKMQYADAPLNNLATIALSEGDVLGAIHYLDEALVIAREKANLIGLGAILNSLGQAWSVRGESEKALNYYTESLEIRQQINDQKGIGVTLSSLGSEYELRGDQKNALEYYLKSLKVCSAIEDKRGMAKLLTSLAGIMQDQGEFEKAINYLETSLSLRKTIGDKAGEAETLNNLGTVYLDCSEYTQAKSLFYASRDLSVAILSLPGEGTALQNLAIIYYHEDNLSKAVEYINRSLEIKRLTVDKRGEAEVLVSFGGILRMIENKEEKALEMLECGLQIALELNMARMAGTAYNNMSMVYKKRNEYQKALEYLNASATMAQKTGDLPALGLIWNNIGVLFFDLNDFDRAIPCLMRSYALFDEIKSANKGVPAEYLADIINQIGKQRFEAILKLNLTG